MVIGRVQSFVESYVPGIPKDAVRGLVKSSVWAFTVAAIATDGDLAACRRSVTLSALASVVHTLLTAFFVKRANPSTIAFATWGIAYFGISGILKVKMIPA